MTNQNLLNVKALAQATFVAVCLVCSIASITVSVLSYVEMRRSVSDLQAVTARIDGTQREIALLIQGNQPSTRNSGVSTIPVMPDVLPPLPLPSSRSQPPVPVREAAIKTGGERGPAIDAAPIQEKANIPEAGKFTLLAEDASQPKLEHGKLKLIGDR